MDEDADFTDEALHEHAFDFVLKSASSYERVGFNVTSPTIRTGRCAYRLVFFPCGTSAEARQRNCFSDMSPSMSASIEVIPEQYWDDSWSFPDVHFSITIKNHSGKDNKRNEAVATFNKQCPLSGWHTFVKRDSWETMERDGWLSSNDEVCITVSIRGKLGRAQPLKTVVSFYV